MTLNEKPVKSLPRRKGTTSNDVWRAERRCQGDDVNMVKLAMEFHAHEEKGEVLLWRKDLTSTAVADRRWSIARCQLVKLAKSSYPCKVEQKAPRNVS